MKLNISQGLMKVSPSRLSDSDRTSKSKWGAQNQPDEAEYKDPGSVILKF